MKRIIFSFGLFFLFTFFVFSQEKTIKYKVEKGDNITKIALKYKVTPFDIYKLNPDAKAGINENQILLIPVSLKSNDAVSIAEKTVVKTHVVETKETLYSIARENNVSVEDIRKANPSLGSDELKIGEAIVIPIKKVSIPTAASVKEKTIYHVVQPKETKFGIAKQYGLTVEELEKQNPEIKDSLDVGFKLTINPKTILENTTSVSQTETKIPVVEKENFYNYEVKPKETLYSLSQSFAITQEELIALNPELTDGVKAGMILKVPGNVKTILKYSNSDLVDLTKTINNNSKKRLALLIPFNASKIQSDTIKSLGTRLKKDAFLNMTLDFYSGVLMAIDKAKDLNLNIDVSIYDSQENKVSSDVENIINRNNLKSVNAIIGPFYQQYVDQVAEMLSAENVPVISPLSKEMGKPIPNSYQAMAEAEYTKKAIFNYMMANNGNIIMVSDPKKVANREYISARYPSVKFVSLTDKGSLDSAQFKGLYVKDKLNYVILDSERTGMILATTNIMLSQKSGYQTQLVILEPNPTLDFEEISLKRLTSLKMLYPSLTRELETDESEAFEEKYKKINNILPSVFAKRGYDLTLDTMLRMSQNESFIETVEKIKSEEIENIFEYSRIEGGGYINTGVFIYEYQDDLTIKQVN